MMRGVTRRSFLRSSQSLLALGARPSAFVFDRSQRRCAATSAAADEGRQPVTPTASAGGGWRRFVRSLMPGLVGFGAGWAGFNVLVLAGYIDDGQILRLGRPLLSAQTSAESMFLAAVERLEPDEKRREDLLTRIRERTGWQFLAAQRLEVLDQSLEEAKNKEHRAAEAGMALRQMLASCAFPEQVEWLTDHCSDSVPYFYVSDLFAAWVAMHYHLLAASAPSSPAASSATGATTIPPVAARQVGTEGSGLSALARDMGSASPWTNSAQGTLEQLESVSLTVGVWRLVRENRLRPKSLACCTLALVSSSPQNAAALLLASARSTVVPAPDEELYGSGYLPGDSTLRETLRRQVNSMGRVEDVKALAQASLRGLLTLVPAAGTVVDANDEALNSPPEIAGRSVEGFLRTVLNLEKAVSVYAMEMVRREHDRVSWNPRTWGRLVGLRSAAASKQRELDMAMARAPRAMWQSAVAELSEDERLRLHDFLAPLEAGGEHDALFAGLGQDLIRATGCSRKTAPPAGSPTK